MIVVAKKVPNNQIAITSIVVHEATNDSNLSIVNKKRLHSNAIWKENQVIAKKEVRTNPSSPWAKST
jgi:hypothetical protein